MLKAAVLKRYLKFWIKRSLKKDNKIETHEEFSTLRLLCEGLLGDDDRKLLEEIMMDDLMERIVDDDEAATHSRLLAELQDKTSRFMVNSYLQDGSTPLHIVAGRGFSESALVMLHKGANPNAVHLQLGHSVLHVAAMSGSYKTMKCLLAHGANRSFVNTLAGRGRTALHYAAEQGSAPCLLMLLNPTQGNVVERTEEVSRVRGVLDKRDTFGNTALHLACVDGSEDCVRMLVESGASVHVRNAEGKSVVDVARAMNSANSSNTTTTNTTSSGGVRVGAVLFMVLMAAGLDPMTESAVLAAADEASHSTSDDQSILRTPSLLDDAEPSSADTNNTTTTNTTTLAQLGAESLQLSTAIATTNSEIFERLCELEDLQQRLNARNKNKLKLEHNTTTDNAGSADTASTTATPVIVNGDDSTTDTTTTTVVDNTAELIDIPTVVLESEHVSPQPLTLQLPVPTTTTYTSTNTTTTIPTTEIHTLPHHTPPPHTTLPPFSPFSPTLHTTSEHYGDSDEEVPRGCVEAPIRTYSPMPPNFKSPALRSPVLHPFHDRGSGVSSSVGNGGVSSGVGGGNSGGVGVGSGGRGGIAGIAGVSDNVVGDELTMEGIELTLNDMHYNSNEGEGEDEGGDVCGDSVMYSSSGKKSNSSSSPDRTPLYRGGNAEEEVLHTTGEVVNEGETEEEEEVEKEVEEEVVWEDLGHHSDTDSDSDVGDDVGGGDDGDVGAGDGAGDDIGGGDDGCDGGAGGVDVGVSEVVGSGEGEAAVQREEAVAKQS